MKIQKACSDFLKHCKYTKQLSYHTITAYNRDLVCFVELTKIKYVDECDKTVLKQYLISLNKMQLSKKTIKRRIACLKTMFRWLELDEVIEINPFHKIEIKIKLPQQLPRNIPKSDLVKVYNAAKHQIQNDRNIPYNELTDNIKNPKQFNNLSSLLAIELLYCTGIRVGELANIKLQHINIVEKRIKIIGKGQRERYVFLPDQETCILIKRYIELRGITNTYSNNLIINSRGGKASTHFLRKLIHKVTKTAKVKTRITPHMYRHTTACTLLDKGLDIRYVQKLLGHQNISTTELYTHVNNQTLQQKIAKINIRRSL